MPRKHRVGLVGLQRGGGLIGVFAGDPRVEVTALCDLDPAVLSELGQSYRVPDRHLYTHYDDLLAAPIDIVVIATPIQLHAGQAIAAMESGKDVLSEVTAAWTLAECEQLVEAVKRTRRVYMMAENACYFHFICQWQEWLTRGRLGKVFYAEAEYVHDLRGTIRDPQTGRLSWRAQRPPLCYCSHSLGPLLVMMQDRIVQATGAGCGYDIMPDLGPGCMNMEVALFKTQKGAVIKLLRSSVAPREPAIHFYSLYGTKGCLESGREGGWETSRGRLYVEGEMSPEQGLQIIDCPIADPAAPEDARAGGHGTTEYYLVRDFLAAVEERARPPIDVIRAVDFTAPGICAHQAAMSGLGWVDVPLFHW